MQAQGHYITGIDDDDEWTPNRLSVFLAHKHQLTTHAFLYANDYVCEGEVYSACQPAAVSEISLFAPLILQAQYYWQSGFYRPGVLKRVCSIPNSRRRRTTTFFCAWWWSMANRGKSKRRRKFYISTTARCRLPLRRKSSPAISIFIVSTKINSIAPVKIPAFTLYQIRNKRMTRRTLLTLLSVRNSKRPAAGLRGDNDAGRLTRE